MPTVARMLEILMPLMPLEVASWQRMIERTKAADRDFLEQHIIENAHLLLGDFDRKLFLSLPPERKASRRFKLGTVVYEKPKHLFGLAPSELMQNFAIFGRSGAGKSNVGYQLILELTREGVPWLFLDVKRTARDLLPILKNDVNVFTPGRSLTPLGFNPFIPPPGVEPTNYLVHLVDAMASAFALGEGAKRIVQKAIAGCYDTRNHDPTVSDVLSAVQRMEAKNRAAGWKVSALRALETLKMTLPSGADRAEQRALANRMLNENTIIELDALDDSTKSFLVPLLCFWIYSARLGSGSREHLRFVVFVEEAHHYLYHNERRSRESLMNRMLRQGRELGIGFVVIDQNPSLISRPTLNNTYTTIVLNLKDVTDINRAAGMCLLDDEQKNWLTRLPVGQGIVKMQDRWRQPFLVEFPLTPIQKGVVSDSMLRAYSAGERKILAESRCNGALIESDDAERFAIGALSEDEFRFLHDVVHHAADSVTNRYRRLEWGARKGQRIKTTLVQYGWLIEEVEPLGTTRKNRLNLAKVADSVVGKTLREIHETMVTHEFWKLKCADIFESEGYSVQLEAERRNGRVDVLVEKNGYRIGIEIETGKSDVVANVKSGLLSRFDRVIVVATGEKALGVVERQLAVAGLLIPKVKIVLRDNYRFEASDGVFDAAA